MDIGLGSGDYKGLCACSAYSEIRTQCSVVQTPKCPTPKLDIPVFSLDPHMKTRTLFLPYLSLVALSLLPLAGCSSGGSSGYGNVQRSIAPAEQLGSVSSIEVIAINARSSGGGAVLGAVLGGVIGHQFGGGAGQRIATGAGVIGGAIAGNQVEKNNKADDEIYRVTVNFDNGRTQQFDYQQIGDLRRGDRVRVAGSQLYQL